MPTGAASNRMRYRSSESRSASVAAFRSVTSWCTETHTDPCSWCSKGDTEMWDQNGVPSFLTLRISPSQEPFALRVAMISRAVSSGLFSPGALTTETCLPMSSPAS